jgi:NADPH-dependent 2,4-dienoyl-CoA reductase/sulfur reductase-like enzyme
MMAHQVVVVGAGPAGLATALALKDAGLRPLVLDQADRVASSWRARYDGLRLNTAGRFSHLPDRPFPTGTPMFPSRDQLIEHHERHAGEDGTEMLLSTRVERIDPAGDGWLLQTDAGEIQAPQAIVATGYENQPFIPDWSGREDFDGPLLHSSEYRNPEPFVGKKVLVVGAGSLGMEIAHELAESAVSKVWLSARTPPNILLRQGPGGLPGDTLAIVLFRVPVRTGDAVTRFARRMDIWDLSACGLPVPEEGVFSRLRRLGVAPAIVDKDVIEAIKSGRIEVVRGVESLDKTGVQLAGDASVSPDALICATGYRRGLEPLVGHLDVLDGRGLPRAFGARPAAPGLRFIGYVQRPAGLRYMGKEAKRAARVISRDLRTGRPRR